MDTETARLVTEADYLVRRVALMAERGIPAESPRRRPVYQVRRLDCGHVRPRLAPSGPVAVSTLWDQGLVTAVQTCGRCPIAHGNCRIRMGGLT